MMGGYGVRKQLELDKNTYQRMCFGTIEVSIVLPPTDVTLFSAIERKQPLPSIRSSSKPQQEALQLQSKKA